MPQAGIYTESNGAAAIEEHAAIADAHHDKVHGAAEHTNVTRELFIPAGACYSNGEFKLVGHWAVWELANGLYGKVAMIAKVPDDFVSFSSLKALWNSPPATGNMYWQFRTYYAAAGEAYTKHLEEPAFGVTATGGAYILNLQEPENPLTLANLLKGDFLGVEFGRSAANPLDTLDQMVRLFGFLFTYVAEQ